MSCTSVVTVSEPMAAVTVEGDCAVQVNVTQQVTSVAVDAGCSRDALFLHGIPISEEDPALGASLIFSGSKWTPQVISGQLTSVEDEIPTGAVDGSNVVFTTAFAYQSLRVYLNGLRQRSGLANDFVELDGTTFAFNSAPFPGDEVRVDYLRV